jgi:hypothetical protein
LGEGKVPEHELTRIRANVQFARDKVGPREAAAV